MDIFRLTLTKYMLYSDDNNAVISTLFVKTYVSVREIKWRRMYEKCANSCMGLNNKLTNKKTMIVT